MNFKMKQEDLKGEYPPHTDFPSRCSIGDEVLFQPDVTKIRYEPGSARGYYTDDSAVKAKVVGVAFVPGKVLYDLVVWMDDEKEFYEPHPIYRVDSYFVLNIPGKDDPNGE